MSAGSGACPGRTVIDDTAPTSAQRSEKIAVILRNASTPPEGDPSQGQASRIERFMRRALPVGSSS